MDPIQSLKAALDGHAAKVETIFGQIQEQVDAIETRLNRPGQHGGGSSADRAAAEQRRVFNAWLKYGDKALKGEEIHALKLADDAGGGYLAPSDFQVELLRNIVQFSPVRQAARVGRTGMTEVKIPRRTGTMTGQWVGETEDRTASEPSYGQLTIPIQEMAWYCDISNAMLEDVAFDMLAELSFDAGEEAGRLEGEAFINGAHPKRPGGFMSTAGGLSSTPSGHATQITGDGLIDVFYALKPYYRNRSAWMMSGTTLAMVRKLKSGDGAYLWQPALAAGQPEILLGRPVFEAVDMPDQGAGTYPIAVGDFNSGYRVYDRLDMSVLRDPYTLATKGQTRFHFRRRVGGGVARSEAIRKLQCAVS